MATGKEKAPSAALLARAASDRPSATVRDTANIAKLAERLREMDRGIAKVEDELKTLNERRRKLAEVDIPMLFDEAGVDEIKLADGTSIKITTAYYPSVKADDRPKLFAWLRKKGFDSIIKNEFKVALGKGDEARAVKLEALLEKAHFVFSRKEDVNPQTFRAFVREQMEAKANLPAFVDPNPVRTTILK